jgi:hypothetical protein
VDNIVSRRRTTSILAAFLGRETRMVESLECPVFDYVVGACREYMALRRRRLLMRLAAYREYEDYERLTQRDIQAPLLDIAFTIGTLPRSE